MKHVLGVALLVAFSTVAVAGVDNIKPSRTLKPEEGILVTSVKCGYPVNFLQIYKSGTASTGFWGPAKFDTVVTCQKGVKTLRMKAGRYYIGWLATGGDGTSIPEADAVKFTIEAGKLNYIGDIYAGNVPPFDMDAETLIHTTGRFISIIDRESEAKSQLAADHGWLLDRHAFMRSMAEEPGASPPKESQEADASAAGGRP